MWRVLSPSKRHCLVVSILQQSGLASVDFRRAQVEVILLWGFSVTGMWASSLGLLLIGISSRPGATAFRLGCRPPRPGSSSSCCLFFGGATVVPPSSLFWGASSTRLVI